MNPPKKRKINAIDDNSDSENDNIPSNKKRKLSQNTNSTNINVFKLMQKNSINKHKQEKLKQQRKEQKKSKQNKNKKKYKISKSKLIEQSFASLSIKQKKALMETLDSDNFSTIAESFGFSTDDIELLNDLLSTYVSDINNSDKNNKCVVFEDKPPPNSCRWVNQLWGKLPTMKAFNKRNILLNMAQEVDITLSQAEASIIQICLSKARICLATITRQSNKKRYQSTEQKLSENDITKNMNKSEISKISDQILILKKTLNDSKKDILKHKKELKHTLTFKLKLVKYNGNEQIQLTKQSINGQKPKGASVVSMFNHVISDFDEMLSSINSKLSLIDSVMKREKKINKNRAKHHKEAKKKDRIRKDKKESEKKEKIGSSSESEFEQYDYNDQSNTNNSNTNNTNANETY
eukprot:448566_1